MEVDINKAAQIRCLRPRLARASTMVARTARQIELARIEAVFGSKPRNGEESALWHKRSALETELHDLFETNTPHVCIDGPTGSGKTSLAITMLSRLSKRYALVQLVSRMTWRDLCIELLRDTPSQLSKARLVFDVDTTPVSTAGDLLRPSKLLERFRISFGEKGQSPEQRKREAEAWSILDVAEMIVSHGAYLLVGDFEKADKNLVSDVADLCKILTEKYEGKVIIIGTGDIYGKLLASDPALDGRVAELSVAAFGDKGDAWAYLMDGFKALGRAVPQYRSAAKREESKEIGRRVFEAADGLPKYINALGHRICRASLGTIAEDSPRMRVTTSDILQGCTDMVTENVNKADSQVTRIAKSLKTNVDDRRVLHAIYDRGANRVHRFSDLLAKVRQVEPNFSEFQLRASLDRLANAALFIQTGRAGEVIFAKDPLVAHVLGLISGDPTRFGKRKEEFGELGQLGLL